ncbi:dihydroxy-acid dehydratase [Labrenzia suaedae]|uniref:Dihydroxy-acid dehydratase n=1 Tax=Roseibium litorale TaxID=2803841 RepID=A0ABR9CP61_9HYPH|nr:dihydroxy-acid dehydratase [Roseibium litorale]
MTPKACKPPSQLRSSRWFAPNDLSSFGHRSRMMLLGYSKAASRRKPVIGILNTWSELNSCHAHFRERPQDVKRGVLAAGGLPTMLYLRNDSIGKEAIASLCALPSVKGVKWATPNPMKLAEAKAACDPSNTWVGGLAEVWAPA